MSIRRIADLPEIVGFQQHSNSDSNSDASLINFDFTFNRFQLSPTRSSSVSPPQRFCAFLILCGAAAITCIGSSSFYCKSLMDVLVPGPVQLHVVGCSLPMVSVLWCGVSGIRRMNEVNPCRARLVHGWMTVFGWLYRLSL